MACHNISDPNPEQTETVASTSTSEARQDESIQTDPGLCNPLVWQGVVSKDFCNILCPPLEPLTAKCSKRKSKAEEARWLTDPDGSCQKENVQHEKENKTKKSKKLKKEQPEKEKKEKKVKNNKTKGKGKGKKTVYEILTNEGYNNIIAKDRETKITPDISLLQTSLKVFSIVAMCNFCLFYVIFNGILDCLISYFRQFIIV